LAHPASAAYRARKYMRRHRVGVAVAAALLVVLIAFGAAQRLQLRRTTRERDRADRITTFMTGMFKVSDPSATRGNSITAREILDKASKEIDTGLAGDPETQAQMMHVMGEVYDNLGLYPQAQSLLTQAVGIRRLVLGPQNPDTLTSMSKLSWNLMEQGRYAEAEKLDRKSLDIRRRVLGREHPETLVSMNNLAAILQQEGRYAEAEKLDRETLDIRRRVLGLEHPDTLRSMSNLAYALSGEGRYVEAEKLDRETLDIRRRVLGPEHPTTLTSMGNLASELRYGGRPAEAEKVDRETLDIRRRVLGPEHPDTLQSMSNLADVLNVEGRDVEAEKLQRETLEIQRRVLGPEHPDTAISTYNLACMSAHRGNRDQALSLLREAVDHGLPPGGRSRHRGGSRSQIAPWRPAFRRTRGPRQRARRCSAETEVALHRKAIMQFATTSKNMITKGGWPLSCPCASMFVCGSGSDYAGTGARVPATTRSHRTQNCAPFTSSRSAPRCRDLGRERPLAHVLASPPNRHKAFGNQAFRPTRLYGATEPS
jgi:tetratricopeptide (TPR) repeat protein